MTRLRKRGLLIICIVLIIGGFFAKYILENVYVTYDEFDESKLTEDEKKFYKNFYSENPELISKGKLFDLKLAYYMANAPLESQVIALKKTSSPVKNITWEIYFEKDNQDKEYVYGIDYKDYNEYIEYVMLRSFGKQQFDEDSLEYPEVNIEDIRIVIHYPGGKEEHKLKLNTTKQYETYLSKPNHTDNDIYFNILYEYDFNRWKQEIGEYMKTSKYISYDLFMNVYNERDFSDKDPIFIYELLKDQILSGRIDQTYLSSLCLETGCYQNDPLTFHYQVARTLSLLYPYVDDEAGKLAILDHFAKRPSDILGLLKEGDIQYMFGLDTQGNHTRTKDDEQLLSAVEYQANYFDILYGIDPLRYVEEYTAYIDELYPIWENRYQIDKNNEIGYFSFMTFLLEVRADKLLTPYILDNQANPDSIHTMKLLSDKYCLKVDEERTYIGFFEYLDHHKVK